MNDDRLADIEAAESVHRLGDQLKTIIQYVATALAGLFTYLSIENAPLDKITQAFDADSLTKVGLFLFFTGWGFGATDDTKIQTIAYGRDDRRGAMGTVEIAGILVFIAVFSLLFVIHEYLMYFQIALLVFILTNIWTYSVVLKRAETIMRDSEKEYLDKKDNYGYFKLFVAVEYLKGRWQRRRFFTLVSLAVFQVFVAALLKYGLLVPMLPNMVVKGVHLQVLASYFPSILFVLYVITSEAWMKIYRYKVFSDFETIEQMRLHCKITRRAGTPLPPINYGPLFRSEPNLNHNYR